jgi:acetyl esterase/lipase
MPEASYDEILSDCKDSLAWSIAHLPEILGQDRIDIARYVVGGDSAGGTLSTLAGHLFEPKPKVVIDVFGLVDSLDLPANRLGVGEWSLKYDNVEEVMEKAKMNRDTSKAEVICPWYLFSVSFFLRGLKLTDFQGTGNSQT